MNTSDEIAIHWELENEVITYNLSYSTDDGVNWIDIALLDDAGATEFAVVIKSP